MYFAIRFIFGLAVGSFLNVLATRYRPEEFLFTRRTMGGRSHCPSCKNILSWYELIPLFSFLFLRGKCRNCKTKISWIYPAGELISALIFAFVPEKIAAISYPAPHFFSGQVLSWVAIFLALQLLSFIDLKWQMVPDEGTLLLIFLGILSAFVFPLKIIGAQSATFIGHFAYLFGLQGSLWSNRIAGMIIATVFFGLLIFITRGRGIGFGDLKFGLALGLIFGWPDAIVSMAIAFIVGAVVGVGLIALKKKTAKEAVPFIPFLALGSATVFFFGYQLLNWYFGLILI